MKSENPFFGTSHSECPCDGIRGGGAIKRDATKASLSAAVDNQIITPK